MKKNEKKCVKCKEIKKLDEFYKNRNKTTSMCKVCTKINNKEYLLDPDVKKRERERQWTKYGIKDMTCEKYEEMLEKQNNCCKICGKHEVEFSKALAVDHNHKTGEVRGLLCAKCNYFLGVASENVGFLRKVLDYLEMKNSLPALLLCNNNSYMVVPSPSPSTSP